MQKNLIETKSKLILTPSQDDIFTIPLNAPAQRKYQVEEQLIKGPVYPVQKRHDNFCKQLISVETSPE